MNDLLYEVENLSDGVKEIVHATRILLYRAELDNLEVDPNLIAHAEHSDALYQDVAGFRGVEQRGPHFFLQVEWTGLTDENDWSWEPAMQLKEGVPVMLEEYLRSPGLTRMKQKVISELQL